MKKLFLLFMMSMAVAAPVTGLAQSEPEQIQDGYKIILDCKGESGAKEIPGSGGEKPCSFGDFMRQIDHIINLLLYVAVVLAVISFVYAGFKLIFSGGNEDAIKHAKHIFWNVLVGLVLAYGAWVIVHFVTTSLEVKDEFTLIKK